MARSSRRHKHYRHVCNADVTHSRNCYAFVTRIFCVTTSLRFGSNALDLDLEMVLEFLFQRFDQDSTGLWLFRVLPVSIKFHQNLKISRRLFIGQLSTNRRSVGFLHIIQVLEIVLEFLFQRFAQDSTGLWKELVV